MFSRRSMLRFFKATTNAAVARQRRRLAIESLEVRQVLSGAPVGVNDSYLVPNHGNLTVGTLGGPLAPDHTLPDPANYTPDLVVSHTSGQHVDAGAWTIGSLAGQYGEISLANPGTSLTLNQYLLAGYEGFAQLSITDGALLHTTNWTELGEGRGGVGSAIVSGTGSQWVNDAWMELGATGRGFLTVENGATMVNGNHLTIGEIGEGRVVVSGGSVFTNNNWVHIARPQGSRGELIVTGAGSAFKNKDHIDVGFAGQAALTVMDGGVFESGNRVEIHRSGRLRGDGLFRSGRFENRGTIEPGAPRGVMTLEGPLTQFGDGRLELEISGTTRGSGYDALDIRGQFQAGGTLVIKFANGFAPRAFDSYELVRANSIVGSFSSVVVQGLTSTMLYRVTIEGGVVRFDAMTTGSAVPVGPKLGVLANDSDPDRDALSTILVKAPTKGRLQLGANGSFSYTAGAAFDGQDEFQYVATDGFFNSQPTTVTVSNPPPVARPDTYQMVEDELFESPHSVLANDTDDVPTTRLTARLVQGPNVGTLDFRSDGTFTYTPEPNFAGSFSFLYAASDGLSESEVTSVDVIVEGRNDPPTAVDDEFATRAGESLVIRSNELTSNDIDPDGPSDIRLVHVGQPDPAQGTVEVISLQFGIRFTPAARFQGDATFAYTIRDNAGIESTAMITVHVGPPNQQPVANRDQKTTTQDTPLRFSADDLTDNDTDPDGDRLRVVSVRDPNHGEVHFAEDDNEIVYTPPAGFVGTAKFKYTITDGHGGTDEGMVEVRVTRPVQQLLGRVQGHGTLDGRERRFSFHADNRRGQSAVSGQLAFFDMEQRLLFHGTSVRQLEISSDGKRATFAGVGRLNGRLGYEFVVEVEDGVPDKFRILITGPNGFQYDSLSHAENGGRIDRGGEIKITPVRPLTLIDYLIARATAFEEIDVVSINLGKAKRMIQR